VRPRNKSGSLARLYLGVDGGQSSTTALIADEYGQVLGVGHGGPCNHVSGDEARKKFRTVIGDCLEQAARGAEINLSSSRFAAACLGFSGGAEDKAEYSRELIQSDRFKVTHDAEIALTGAMEGEPGIIVIAGTGSIAFGRNAAGRTARAGGWGYVFGDEGSAFDIARRALRAALQMEEGWGEPTVLRERLLEMTSAGNANEILHRSYAGMSRQEMAAWAPLVTQAAEEGDDAARRILTEAAAALSWYVEGVHRNLFATGERVSVAHIGGVFQSAPLRLAFTRQVETKIGGRATFPRLSPAAGALLEALRMDRNTAKLNGVPETKR
jgi:N-acetylglucosamine kinase-like BadF-type ATPase